MEKYCVSCKKYTANENSSENSSDFYKSKKLHNF